MKRGIRAVALLMVLMAVVAVAANERSAYAAGCSCQQNQECSLGGGCYSAGGCAPPPGHRSCEAEYNSNQGTWYCHWVADLGC